MKPLIASPLRCTLKAAFLKLWRIYFQSSKKRNHGLNNLATGNYNPNPRKRFSLNLKQIKFSNQLIAVIVIAVIALVAFGFWFKKATGDTRSSTSNGGQEQVTPPYATKQINRDFSFPLRDDKGKEVVKFKYTVQNAELTREIVVKGQKGTAVKGRTFLILNLKINNDGEQRVQINSRDYIRLIVNGNDKDPLAPDIHNDPVEVQPISTKFTRLGFAINDTDTNLKVQVGEIEGDKQFIELSF